MTKAILEFIGLVAVSIAIYLLMGLGSLALTWFANTTAWFVGPAMFVVVITACIGGIAKIMKEN